MNKKRRTDCDYVDKEKGRDGGGAHRRAIMSIGLHLVTNVNTISVASLVGMRSYTVPNAKTRGYGEVA